MSLTRETKIRCLWAIAAAAVLAAFIVPPIPQDTAYHHFADQRAGLGIANAWNVLSNLAFLAVGALGLAEFRKGAAPRGSLPELRVAYLAFFLGVALIGPGSAYYHLAPDNGTLVYDRLPMTVAFMGLFAAIIGEHVSVRAGRLALWPLLAAGLFSIWYWRATETMGQGDLRPYGLVQFLPMALVPLILFWFKSPFATARRLWNLLLLYVAAKAAEGLDDQILALTGGALGGHALKHLLAAAGTWQLVLAVRHRRLV